MDVVVANARHWPQPNRIFFNNGKGQFSQIVKFDFKDDSIIDVEVTDIDKDGDKGLVLANKDKQQNFIYFGDKGMDYSHNVVYDNTSNNSHSLDLDDIDGNGSIDILVANMGEPNMVFLNLRKGASWKEISLRNESLSTYDIVLADLNNDERLDIIESNSDGINYFCLNR